MNFKISSAQYQKNKKIRANNSKKLVPNHLEVLDMFKKLSYKETNYHFEFSTIASVELNKDVKLTIQLYSDLVALNVNDNIYVTSFKMDKKLLMRANPYFGGNKVAPNKMSLRIR